MIRTDPLRKQIESELGSLIPERMWRHLDNEGMLHKCRIGEYSAATVADKIRQWKSAMAGDAEEQPKLRKDRGGKATGPRLTAISEVVGDEASHDSDVESFRADVLHGQLLNVNEIEDWILQQAEADGPHTVCLLVPVPPGEELRVRRLEGDQLAIVPANPISICRDRPAISTRVEDVAFPVSNRHPMRMPVALGGVLDQLRHLSAKLAAKYGWKESEATAFVLAGAAPEVAVFSCRIDKRDVQALNRVVLSLDPALSPRELANHYRDTRRRLFGKRYRSMSQKHITLVSFKQSRPKNETYAQNMKAWNKQYPKWKYRRETIFGRDVIAAQKRLLRPTGNDRAHG